MSGDKFTVFYRCAGCGYHELAVRYRRRREDIVDWIEGVVRPAIRAAHSKICTVSECDIIFPTNEASPVGMKIEH